MSLCLYECDFAQQQQRYKNKMRFCDKKQIHGKNSLKTEKELEELQKCVWDMKQKKIIQQQAKDLRELENEKAMEFEPMESVEFKCNNLNLQSASEMYKKQKK